jgi:proteasome lid subunit RPN8/RPN11
MLTQSLIDELLHFARVHDPKEMCGLLFHEHGFWSCKNVARDPEHEFELDHLDYLYLCMKNDAKPWALVHSHPGTGAGPSVKDCQLMDALQVAGQDLAMVIVGLQPVEIRCFKKRGELYELQWAQVPAKQPMTLAALKQIREALRKNHDVTTVKAYRSTIDHDLPPL